MVDVLLVTCAEHPDGEPGGDLLGPLTARGLDGRWAVWDDPAVDWSAAPLVVVRSTWDYQDRPAEFLRWARRVEDGGARLLNGADVFARNVDKRYLLDLAVPTVPTRLLDTDDPAPGVGEALDAWGEVVVKPRTGASGVGVLAIASAHDPRIGALAGTPSIVQPLLRSVTTTGETSVFVLDGRAVSQVEKRPAAGEIRVHDEYGGRTRPVPVDAGRAALAEDAVRSAAGPEDDLAYARVDLLAADDGAWLVGEVELVEPGLYLDVLPENAERFGDLVAAHAARG